MIKAKKISIKTNRHWDDIDSLHLLLSMSSIDYKP